MEQSRRNLASDNKSSFKFLRRRSGALLPEIHVECSLVLGLTLLVRRSIYFLFFYVVHLPSVSPSKHNVELIAKSWTVCSVHLVLIGDVCPPQVAPAKACCAGGREGATRHSLGRPRHLKA